MQEIRHLGTMILCTTILYHMCIHIYIHSLLSPHVDVGTNSWPSLLCLHTGPLTTLPLLFTPS